MFEPGREMVNHPNKRVAPNLINPRTKGKIEGKWRKRYNSLATQQPPTKGILNGISFILYFEHE
jgi:hypothetical protein